MTKIICVGALKDEYNELNFAKIGPQIVPRFRVVLFPTHAVEFPEFNKTLATLKPVFVVTRCA